MSQPINFRRGTALQRQGITLGAGEPGWDTDTKRLFVGDGTTAGGVYIGGSPATTDFTIHAATSALGGRTAAAGASGLSLKDSTNTSTAANKLIDTAGGFTSAHLNKTVYNKTEDKWAKITNIDSSTQVTLSADIFTGTSRQYAIADALDNVADAVAAVPTPFSVNVTIRVSPGTFSGAVTVTGKLPAGDKTLSWQGNSLSATTISGLVNISQQKITIGYCTFTGGFNANYGASIVWSNCPLQCRVNAYNGSELDWTTCNMSGAGKLYTYTGSSNTIRSSTGVVVGNDPQGITAISSTITKGYTLYVATSTYGGSDSTGDGLPMASGTTTGTTANKLVDSGASFTSSLVNKTVYNATDDTWAKVTAVDSATQLSLSVDIMVSGEAYVIANTVATPQVGISKVPGSFNCDTTIKISDGTYGATDFGGKNPTGPYKVTLEGTMTILVASQTATSGAASTLTKTGATWTVDAYKYKRVRIISGNGAGQIGIIKSNTATVLTIEGTWAYTTGDSSGTGVNPNSTSVFIIEDWGTDLNVTTNDYPFLLEPGQTTTKLKSIKTTGTVYIQGGSAFESFGCWHYSSTTSGILLVGRGVVIEAAIGRLYSSLVSAATQWGVQYIDGASGIMGGCLVYNSQQYNIFVTSSFVKLYATGSDTNVTATYHGIAVDRNGIITFGSGSSACRSDNSKGYGVYASKGGQTLNVSSGSYTGNTSGTYSADATTFGYAG